MYSLADHVMISQLDKELVILDSDSGTYYGLNPSAATFVDSLIELDSFEKACDRVLEVFDVTKDTVVDDMHSLLGTLNQMGFIQVDDQSKGE